MSEAWGDSFFNELSAKEKILITPELKARIVAPLDGFSYYESVPISQIDECKAILKELGEDND